MTPSLRSCGRALGILCLAAATFTNATAENVRLYFTSRTNAATLLTNSVTAVPISGNILANGGVVPTGVPFSITFPSSGVTTQYLAAGYYALTNRLLGASGIVLRIYDDSTDLVDYTNRLWSGYNKFVTSIVTTNDTAAGSATNVFFYPGQNTAWRTSGGSNVVDITGTLTNATTGNAATATYAGYASYVTNNFYYVDITNGVNSANAGTVAQPFKNIGYAASNTPPRATINITNGVYAETISRTWGEKIYNLAAGAVVTGATNANANAQAVSGDTVNSHAANWPMIFRGRGTFVSKGSGVVQLDNGRLEMEAQLIKNYGSGVAIDVQGDNADGDDPRSHVQIKNARIVGQVWADTFTWSAAGCTIELTACSIITTNKEPFDFSSFLEDDDAKYMYLVLNGVESRCAQTNLVTASGYGPRFFGELTVDPNLSE